jgi:hypothetical protein
VSNPEVVAEIILDAVDAVALTMPTGGQVATPYGES